MSGIRSRVSWIVYLDVTVLHRGVICSISSSFIKFIYVFVYYVLLVTVERLCSVGSYTCVPVTAIGAFLIPICKAFIKFDFFFILEGCCQYCFFIFKWQGKYS